MSGSGVPYHLRPNKFVERQLFIDILAHLGAAVPIKDYVYVSMGGRFLEDFKLVHSRLGIKELVSFEEDALTFDRQLFNSPFALIKCHNKTSGDFILNFDQFADGYNDPNFIIWLDYAVARDRDKQLREFQELISKLTPLNVVKITLNANSRTLGEPTEFESYSDFQKAALEQLRSRLGEFYPEEPVDPKEFNDEKMAAILANAVKMAALGAVSGTPDYVVQPLAAFRYNDGYHQMLTVTSIVLEAAQQDTFNSSVDFDKWLFRSNDWNDVQLIAVPDLSIKERMWIDEKLFVNSDEVIHGRLPFKFHKNNDKSLAVLRAYIEHYKRYPNFVRVMV